MKNYFLGLFKNLLHVGTLIGLFIAIAIPLLVYLGPNVGHKSTIHDLDLNLPLPLFFIQLIAGIVLLVLLRKDLRDWLRSILPQKPYSILAISFTLAITIFAGTQIDARHRVQSDESVFLSVAQNMNYNQQAGTCNQGYFTDEGLSCVSTSNSFKTKGLSFLYLLGMPLLGTDLHWVFSMELLMLPLAILLMFLAIVAWTRQPLLAFFAALLTGLQPTVLFQFRSMSVEPLYIFLSASALLTFKWAYDRNTVKHWALSALVLAFFAQTRQETVFCFAPFILFAIPKLLDKKSYKAPAFFVLLSIFSVPVLLTISLFQGFGFQGGEFEAHGHFLEDVAKNWEVMTTPLKENGELANPFLTYFNYLFAIGGLYLIFRAIYDCASRKDESRFFYLKVLAFVVLYHIQTYVILENVSGDFSIEINQRYSLVMLPTMAFLAALPVSHFVQFLAGIVSKEKNSTSVTLIFALLVSLGFSCWTFHYKEDFNKNIMYNRNHLTTEESEILKWLHSMPTQKRLFIYGRPWHFIGYGISAIHYDRAKSMSNQELKSLIDKYQGEVYYIRGLDCWNSQTYHKKAVEHRIASTCDIFERDMDLEGVKNILITNNYWVQIAKFNGRRDYNPANVIEVSEPELNVPADSTETSGLLIQSVLKELSEATRNWSYSISVNGEPAEQKPYNAGAIRLLYPAEKLQPGFNTINFIVTDNIKRTVLADIQKTYFYDSEGVLPLTHLEPKFHQQGWGSLHKNLSTEGNSLKVGGKIYTNGLGTHAPSTTTYNLGGKFKKFKALAGLDEESLCSDGVKIQIFGDGALLFESETIQIGNSYLLDADLSNVQEFTIQSHQLETDNCDHVDILNPVLIP